MAKKTRKFKQQFYVGEIIERENDTWFYPKLLKVLSVRFSYEGYLYNVCMDGWRYTFECLETGRIEKDIIDNWSTNNYKLIEPTEERLWNL